MQGLNTVEDARNKAEELRSMMQCVYNREGKDIKISASIGVSIAGTHGYTYQELYINADSALYVAKNSGKNNYQISD